VLSLRLQTVVSHVIGNMEAKFNDSLKKIMTRIVAIKGGNSGAKKSGQKIKNF